MRKIYLLISFFFIIFLFQCQLKNDYDKQKPATKYMQISSDKKIYSYSNKERINITAVNTSQQTLFYLSPSINATLQRYESGEWLDLGPWYDVIAIVPSKISVSAGDKIPVTSLTSDYQLFEKPGRYRICLTLYTDKNVKLLLPFEDRVSNSFEIVE